MCKPFPTFVFPRHKIVTFGRSFQTNNLVLTVNYLDTSSSGPIEADYVSTGTVPYDTWTHVAVTFGSTEKLVKFYIGGVLDTTIALSPTIIHLYQNQSQPFLIGKKFD